MKETAGFLGGTDLRRRGYLAEVLNVLRENTTTIFLFSKADSWKGIYRTGDPFIMPGCENSTRIDPLSEFMGGRFAGMTAVQASDHLAQLFISDREVRNSGDKSWWEKCARQLLSALLLTSMRVYANSAGIGERNVSGGLLGLFNDLSDSKTDDMRKTTFDPPDWLDGIENEDSKATIMKLIGRNSSVTANCIIASLSPYVDCLKAFSGLYSEPVFPALSGRPLFIDVSALPLKAARLILESAFVNFPEGTIVAADLESWREESIIELSDCGNSESSSGWDLIWTARRTGGFPNQATGIAPKSMTWGHTRDAEMLRDFASVVKNVTGEASGRLTRLPAEAPDELDEKKAIFLSPSGFELVDMPEEIAPGDPTPERKQFRTPSLSLIETEGAYIRKRYEEAEEAPEETSESDIFLQEFTL